MSPDNLTIQDYIKYLHIQISHLPEWHELRDEMSAHLMDQKEQLLWLETCYNAPAYESPRSL